MRIKQSKKIIGFKNNISYRNIPENTLPISPFRRKLNLLTRFAPKYSK